MTNWQVEYFKNINEFPNICFYVIFFFCFNERMHSRLHKFLQNPITRVIQHDSYEFLVMLKYDCVSQILSTPIKLQWGWGQVTMTVSITVRTLWCLRSYCKALGCVWGHYPAAVWIIVHKNANQRVQHVSEVWSGTCLWSGWSQFGAE